MFEKGIAFRQSCMYFNSFSFWYVLCTVEPHLFCTLLSRYQDPNLRHVDQLLVETISVNNKSTFMDMCKISAKIALSNCITSDTLDVFPENVPFKLQMHLSAVPLITVNPCSEAYQWQICLVYRIPSLEQSF